MCVCACVYECVYAAQKKGAGKSISQSFSLGAFPSCLPCHSSCVVKLKIIFTFYFIFMFAPRKFFLPFSCFPIAGHRRV